jgi:hypothetical protein
MNENHSLSKVIKEYISKKSNHKDKAISESVLVKGILENIDGNIKIEKLVSNNPEYKMFEATIKEAKKLNFNKYPIYKVLDDFFTYLKRNYSVEFDINKYFEKTVKNKNESQLDILKELHGSGKTKEDLMKVYAVNERTLHTDLTELQNGVSFLDQPIKINIVKKHGKNTYNSTVHPVFLPLNLTEAYALTAYLKKISRGTEYGEVLNDMADWIYSQLSPYGKGRIDRSVQSRGECTSFNIERPGFRDENDLIEKRRSYRIMNREKTMESGSIKYEVDGESKTITGKMYYIGKNKVRIVPDRGEEFELDINCVLL